jgi:hypothetical protein
MKTNDIRKRDLLPSISSILGGIPFLKEEGFDVRSLEERTEESAIGKSMSVTIKGKTSYGYLELTAPTFIPEGYPRDTRTDNDHLSFSYTPGVEYKIIMSNSKQKPILEVDMTIGGIVNLTIHEVNLGNAQLPENIAATYTLFEKIESQFSVEGELSKVGITKVTKQYGPNQIKLGDVKGVINIVAGYLSK